MCYSYVCPRYVGSDVMYEYVAGILHTIFFHRTLTLVRPKDVDCDLFEITYVSTVLFLEEPCYSPFHLSI